MRVIAGSAKRLQLKTLDGLDTRPTTDRIKETLFNMISPYLYDCRFLDLFAGSGGIGIEALSRGAGEAVFVEQNPKAMACIKENLKENKIGRTRGDDGDRCYDCAQTHGRKRNILTYIFYWIRHIINCWKSRCWSILQNRS